MSYGAMMAGPPPDGGQRCPHCGAPLKPGQTGACWLCLEEVAIREGTPDKNRGTLPAVEKPLAGDHLGWAAFGVLAILVCVAMAFEVPGVLIGLLIVAAPAFIRAIAESGRKPDEAAIARKPSFISLFLGTLGVTVFVGIAASAAFFAACFSVGFAGLALVQGESGLGIGIMLGLLAGGIAGILVAVWLFTLFWKRKA